MRFPESTDINISLNPDKAVKGTLEVRQHLARRLFKLYKKKNIVNAARSFASCKACNGFCYFVENDELVNLTKCQIIDKRDGFDILIPVQLIHILSEHLDEPIDAQLFEYYETDEAI